MSRKTADTTIVAEGRDKDKLFRITELPAEQIEKWAIKAFLAMARAGVNVPDDIRAQGIIGIAILGLKSMSTISSGEAFELMDEMFSCVKFVPDKENHGFTRAPQGDDIEEVATRIKLREDIFYLHVGFSFAEALSRWTSAS